MKLEVILVALASIDNSCVETGWVLLKLSLGVKILLIELLIYIVQVFSFLFNFLLSLLVDFAYSYFASVLVFIIS